MSDRRKINLSLKNNGSENKSIFLLLFSHSVISNTLQPHELKYARLPCPSPPPGAYSNSYPLCQWHHSNFLSSYIHLNSLFIFLLLTSRRKWGKCIRYIYIYIYICFFLSWMILQTYKKLFAKVLFYSISMKGHNALKN